MNSIVIDRHSGTTWGAPAMRTAVLVPCYNEEATIGKVVADFRNVLPEATVYVYDNASTDKTAAVARRAGAVVQHEPLRGKGNVVRRMFADIEADIYVLVDGDDTYDVARAPELVQTLIDDRLDMVTGRRSTDVKAAYRPGHKLGNRLFSGLVRNTFGDRVVDMLSGYRVLSRRFVKSFPALSKGFEIETELTVHALELRMPMAEVETHYKERPEGSVSKLNSYRDGFRILKVIMLLIKEERPLQFFSFIFLVLALTSIGLATILLIEFLQTGLVPRIPTAILSTGMMLLAFLSLAVGLTLDTVTRGRQEMKRLTYLGIPGIGSVTDAYPAVGLRDKATVADQPADHPADHRTDREADRKSDRESDRETDLRADQPAGQA